MWYPEFWVHWQLDWLDSIERTKRQRRSTVHLHGRNGAWRPYYVGELLRIKGQLALQSLTQPHSVAEECFNKAISVSRVQGALT